MKPILQRLSLLALIFLVTASAVWIVLPSGSRINLNKLKINYNQSFPAKLGLDLKGGSRLVYQADFSQAGQSSQADALSAVRSTIERRVNAFGVSEPTVQVQGTDQISVELPGITDINKAIEQIGQTPLLEFKIQKPQANQQATVDANGEVNIDASSLWENTSLTGKQLKRATADVESSGTTSLSTQMVVKLEFDDEGTKLFRDITAANVGKQVAIFLDGQIISAPTVQTAITDGIAIISGNFTPQTAKDFATRLNSGALPVPIELISQENVGATLGAESVEKSLVAGIIGLILVALFMILNYRLPGLLAVGALLVYAVISLAVFKVGISLTAVIIIGLCFFLSLRVSGWFGLLGLLSYIALLFAKGLAPVTLTLAGIAGFILSIGMAVDANILIFARIKEELRKGRPVKSAITEGFNKAWLSIRDSNISSLITTAILYAFGTPSIKGFAVTLAIGVIISLFTAITVTRTFLELVLNNKYLGRLWLFGVSKVDHQA